MLKRDLNLVWKSLADPNRRAILELLRKKPRTTGDVCAQFAGLSRFAVMKHLAQLERSRLVRTRRDGRLRWNHLNPAPILEIEQEWFRPYRKARSR